LLNPGLDFDKLNLIFQEKRRIVIPDFLEEKSAEQIYQGFQDITARNLWYQVNFGNPRYYDKSLPENERIKPHFSYKFEKYPVKNMSLRSLLLIDAQRHDIEKLRYIADYPELELEDSHPFRIGGEILNSQSSHAAINKITGMELAQKSVKCFASRYTAGNYLATHSDDGPPRMIAFVLNFTKHWLPHWGGNLVIFDGKVENIIETFTPRFNTMILFEVPIHHAVLPVSIYCPSERLALSGWYHNLKLPWGN
jgi:SM-20-related protein